jgi:hypothetical protein
VLKPGGTLVIACWCQRDSSTQPLTPSEQRRVDFMCTEWSHPYFISIKVSQPASQTASGRTSERAREGGREREREGGGSKRGRERGGAIALVSPSIPTLKY